MSKYNKLLGLARELLPSGERVLVREGDDLLRALHGLDERTIENTVSQMDALHNANTIRRNLRKKLVDDSLPYSERKAMRRQLQNDLSIGPLIEDPTREVGMVYFPPEYDKHLNLDEVRDLSKQYKDSLDDTFKVDRERDIIRRKLQDLNPDSDLYHVFDNDDLKSYLDYDKYGQATDSVARQRFKKIRDAMKDKK